MLDNSLTVETPINESTIYQENEPFLFQTDFQGSIEMHADKDTVAQYLAEHEGWFVRCAQPMKVVPLGDNGYTITVGTFGAFGYQVEPKISVVLDPPQDDLYIMKTVPMAEGEQVGYEVVYEAQMQLVEVDQTLTKLGWELHLEVKVSFPKFIYRLPVGLIKTTGDRLLSQIIRQVSPRLNHKVQKDFHTRHGLPIPPKSSIQLKRIDRLEDEDL